MCCVAIDLISDTEDCTTRSFALTGGAGNPGDRLRHLATRFCHQPLRGDRHSVKAEATIDPLWIAAS
jgi:hypothetical protein